MRQVKDWLQETVKKKMKTNLSTVSIAFAWARLGLSVQSANACNSWQSRAMSRSNVAMSTGIVGVSGAAPDELEEGGSGTTAVRETGMSCCSILLTQKKMWNTLLLVYNKSQNNGHLSELDKNTLASLKNKDSVVFGFIHYL